MVPKQTRERQIIPLAFQNYAVRAVLIDGVPWFIAKDVCDVLGLGNPTETLRNFPKDEKGISRTDTLGGKQEMLIVNEPGLYRLVFQSRKPEAERFKVWVFGEVLPQIRQTGFFIPETPDPDKRRLAAVMCYFAAKTRRRQETLEAGKNLTLLKQSMRHGEFLPFLASMRIPHRSAAHYMKLFREATRQITGSSAHGFCLPIHDRQLSLFSIRTELPLMAC